MKLVPVRMKQLATMIVGIIVFVLMLRCQQTPAVAAAPKAGVGNMRSRSSQKLRSASPQRGIIVGVPLLTAPSTPQMSDFTIAVGLYLMTAVGGQPTFGQSPAPFSIIRTGGQRLMRFSASDVPDTLHHLGATHLAVGQLSPAGDKWRLSYQWYTIGKGGKAVPVGSPVVDNGTLAEIDIHLSNVANKLLVALGDRPTAFSPGLTVEEMTSLAELTHIASWTQKQFQTAKTLAGKSPFGALFLSGIASWSGAFDPEPLVKSILAVAPENAAVWSQIAIQHPEALISRRATLIALQKKYPHNYQLAQARSLIERASGNLVAEQAAGEQAVAAAPGNADAYLIFAKTLSQKAESVRKGRFFMDIPEKDLPLLNAVYQKWVENTRRATQIDPTYGTAWLRYATASTFAGDSDNATKAIERAVALSPADGEVYDWALQMFQPKWGGDPATLKKYAQKTADAGLQLDFQSVISLAGTLEHLKFSEEADRLYDNALIAGNKRIAANPNDVYGYYLRAYALEHQKKMDEALAAFQKIIEIQPEFFGGYYHLGFYLARRGRQKDAVPILEKGHQLNPSDVITANQLAYSYMMIGRLEDAEKVTREIIASNPNYGLAYMVLGEALWRDKKRDPAIDAYKKALDTSPYFDEAYRSIGNIYYEEEKWGPSIEWYTRLLQRQPNNLLTMELLGYLYNQNKQFKEGEAMNRELLSRTPDNSNGHVNLGNSLLGLGKVNEARKEWTRAVELGGRPEVVQEAKDCLNKYPETQ